jgi:modulator of FtsH protease
MVSVKAQMQSLFYGRAGRRRRVRTCRNDGGVTAYNPSEWSDLFVATAGASAALLGLLFVAVSINLERILQFEGLPGRALETLIQLMGVLVVSIAGLIPAQSEVALGIELLLIVAVIGAIIFKQPVVVADETGREPMSWKISRWTARLAGIVPIAIAGASLLLEAGGGLYWLAAGIVLAVAAAVAGAWVLLVEIQR